jgi:MFS family permease
MYSGNFLIVLAAGIIGTTLAPTEDLATLPPALVIVGQAAMTLPVGRLLEKHGRKHVFIGFAWLTIAAALLAAWSIDAHHFSAFCIATLTVGGGGAAVQQYRFAAIERVAPDRAAAAASAVLVGGIAAAFIGPEIAFRARDWFATPFVGSFVALAGVYLAGAALLTRSTSAATSSAASAAPVRPVLEVMRQPVVVLAVATAAIGFGVMSFIMTATPISMHNHFGHSLSDTKWVIQSHVAAMYVPSLVSGWLIDRLGFVAMISLGLAAMLGCAILGVADPSVAGFWASLLLLGIGWNFLFVCGTALLHLGHRPSERFRVQSTNDFLVFSLQALAALSSGWFLFHWQWDGVLRMCIPPLLAMAVVLFALRRAPREATALSGV